MASRSNAKRVYVKNGELAFASEYLSAPQSAVSQFLSDGRLQVASNGTITPASLELLKAKRNKGRGPTYEHESPPKWTPNRQLQS